MKAIFPAWGAAIRDPEVEAQARTEWLKGFIENGIATDTQINAGLSKCRTHDSPFLPSIGQFIAWCAEAAVEASGFPSESEARLAMIRELGKSADIREWHSLHPVIYWVYTQRSGYDWKQMSTKDLNDAFSENWDVAVRMAKKGHQFESPIPPSRQIEQKEKYNPDLAVKAGKCELDRLMEMFKEPEPAPLTHAEIADNERLERIKNNG